MTANGSPPYRMERMYYCDSETGCPVRQVGPFYTLPEGWVRAVNGDTFCWHHADESAPSRLDGGGKQ